MKKELNCLEKRAIPAGEVSIPVAKKKGDYIGRGAK